MSFAGAQPGFSHRFDDGRCPATRFDARCQLEAGHESGRHVALVTHASSRRRGYSVWTQDGWSSWEAEIGPQPWAASFPRSA